MRRLEQQLAFLREIDALKSVTRRSLLLDGSRVENTAEHSWHLALFVDVLAEHAEPPVDRARVVRMLLIHDIVEIDAGDTFLYAQRDPAVREAKAAAEREAAERIFGLLPPDQGAAFRALWDEFEHGDTADARFARAVDRLQPLMLNRLTEGHTWKANGVTRSMVLEANAHVREGSPRLWGVVEQWIEESVALGYLGPE